MLYTDNAPLGDTRNNGKLKLKIFSPPRWLECSGHDMETIELDAWDVTLVYE